MEIKVDVDGSGSVLNNVQSAINNLDEASKFLKGIDSQISQISTSFGLEDVITLHSERIKNVGNLTVDVRESYKKLGGAIDNFKEMDEDISGKFKGW